MYKVVIVDDESIVRLAIKSMVNWQELGYNLAGTAGDGISALKIIEKYEADLVITDLKMPNMDGIELIKELKNRNFQGEVLVLSNYNDFMLVKEAMKLGIHDYILKITVKSEDFISLLKEIENKLDTKEKNKKLISDNVLFDVKGQVPAIRPLSESEDFKYEVLEKKIFSKGKIAVKLYYSFVPEWQNRSRVEKGDIIIGKVLEDLFWDLYRGAEIVDIYKAKTKYEYLILVAYRVEEEIKPEFISISKLSETIKMYYDLQCCFIDTDIILNMEQFRVQYEELKKRKALVFHAGGNCKREVVEAFTYIHENVCKKITVAMIAEKIKISEAYLCKIFKEETGDTIINYLNKLKMNKAYEFLKNSDLYIKEISMMVGIEDQFYFNRLFKKYYGISPKEVRKNKNGLF